MRMSDRSTWTPRGWIQTAIANVLVRQAACLALGLTIAMLCAGDGLAAPGTSAAASELDALRAPSPVALKSGDEAKALEISRQLADQVGKASGLQSVDYARAQFEYAAALVRAHKAEAAEPVADAAWRIFHSQLGDQNDETLGALTLRTVVLLDLDRDKDALQLSRQALELARSRQGSVSADVLSLMGVSAQALEGLGHFQEAADLRLEILESFVKLKGETSPQVSESLLSLAASLDAMARYEEAQSLADRAYGLRKALFGDEDRRTVDAFSQSAIYRSHADAERKFLIPDSTLDLLKTAAARTEEAWGPNALPTIAVLEQYAAALLRNFKYVSAEPIFGKTCQAIGEIYEARNPRFLTCVANYAVVMGKLGGEAEAENLTNETLRASILVRGEDHPETIGLKTNLAELRLGLPDKAASALEPARSAAAAWRARRAETGFTPSAQAHLDTAPWQAQNAFQDLADADWEAAKAHPAQLDALRTEAFVALQDAMAGRTNQAVTLMAARRAAARKSDEIGVLVDRRQSLLSAFRDNEAAILAAFAQGSEAAVNPNSPQADLQVLRSRKRDLVAELAQIDDRVKQGYPQYYALTRPEAVSLDRARALLTPDEAVLMLVPTDHGTHVMVLTRDGLTWVRSSLTRESVGALVRLLRQDLAPTGPEKLCKTLSQADCPEFHRNVAYDLYRELVAPVEPALAGKRHVFVAAQGSLASLPLGVMVREAPKGKDFDPAALRATSWLADARYALIQIPSFQSLYLLRNQDVAAPRPVGDADDFAGFGDPNLGGPGDLEESRLARGAVLTQVFGPGRTRDGAGIADLGELRRLPPLPGTGEELEALRNALDASPDTVRLLGEATETAVKQSDLRNVRVIAFATHGLLAGEVDGLSEPGLVLSLPANPTAQDDGLLTASEITTLNLNADWVILSACNTAGGDGEGTPGLSGLARAFFYAGARSLLASHWPVRDDIAPRLTVQTIIGQREHPDWSRAQALQAAMRDIRNTADDPSTAHPSAWAPFVLVGEAN